MSNTFTHPEQKDAETFFMNVHQKDFDALTYKSKRMGTVAYDGNGKKLKHEDWFPVFLATTEVTETDKSISDLRRGWREKNEQSR